MFGDVAFTMGCRCITASERLYRRSAAVTCCSGREIFMSQMEDVTVDANMEETSVRRFRKRECKVVSWLCAWACE